MNFNIDSVKELFIEYLKENKIVSSDSDEKNQESEENLSVDDDISLASIFTEYSSEFKTFLAQEYSLDSSLFDFEFNASDLKRLYMKDGELKVRKNHFKNDDEMKKLDEFSEFLNELLQDEDFISKLDGDEDEQISTRELQKFLKFAKDEDEDKGNLTFKDMFLGYEKAQQEDFVPFGKKDDADDSETEASQSSSGGGGGYGGGGGGVSSNSLDSNNPDKEQVQEKNYKAMNIEQLTQEKEAQTELYNQYNQELQQFYSGELDFVKEIDTQVEQAKTTYEEALKQDEKVSDELKQQSSEVENNITAKEQEISQKNVAIANLDMQITTTNTSITAAKSNVAALETSLSALSSTPTTTSDGQNIQQDISSKKAAIQNSINAQNQKIKELEQQLQDYTQQKEQAQTELKEFEQNLTDLYTQKQEVDSKIQDSASDETKAALDTYNSMKSEAILQKQQMLTQATETLASEKNKLDEINKIYNDKLAKQTQKEYGVGETELFRDDVNLTTEMVERGADGMSYYVIGPENPDPNEELPVLVYLHGSGEIGTTLNTIKSHPSGAWANAQNWEQLGLSNFNGYIICPLLNGGSWANDATASQVRDVVNQFSQNHSVNSEKIAVAGHSYGGAGAEYYAKTMGDLFTSAAAFSTSPSTVDLADVNIPIYGYSGSGDSGIFQTMQSRYGDNFRYNNSGHNNVPDFAFCEDTNQNGCPDLFELLFDN